MNLTPLLLTSRIPKLITPSMRPDILRNLLPRNLRHAHAALGFRTNGNTLTEELGLYGSD